MRYLKKILTDIEIDELHLSDSPDQALWSYWACKEAAYKVIQKITSDAAFVPRRWSVCYQDPSLNHGWDSLPTTDKSPVRNITSGVVIVPEIKEIPVYIESTPDYVHCVAADGYNGLSQVIRQVDVLRPDTPGAEENPSTFVRLRLIRRIESLLQAVPGSIEIRRTKKNGEFQPPVVYYRGARVEMDISLSHDGRFCAYALLTRQRPKPV